MAQTYRKALLGTGTLLGISTAAMLLAACGSSAGSTASATAVSARQLTGVGSVLVNSSGMTVYSVKTPSEVNGNIKCTSSCLTFWFPVTASSVNQGSSGLPGKLSTVHRPDGKTQLTYNGMPLYAFKLDTPAGQANGNNFTDHFNGTTFRWQAVTTSGTPASGGSPAPAPSYSSSGYGY